MFAVLEHIANGEFISTLRDFDEFWQTLGMGLINKYSKMTEKNYLSGEDQQIRTLSFELRSA